MAVVQAAPQAAAQVAAFGVPNLLLNRYAAAPDPVSPPMLLGAGGFGKVFLYRDTLNNQLVAIKRMQLTGLQPADAAQLYRFLPRELRVHYKLNHPHIVKMHNAMLQDGCLFIVLEYVAGGTLLNYFNRINTEQGRISEGLARHYLQHLVATLDYMHAKDCSHRDIKLDNAMAQAGPDRPMLKVVDFGLSREGALANTNVGTREYKAPEIFHANHANNYNPALVDVWSAGVLLYAALNMVYPWPSTVGRVTLPANVCWQKMHTRPLEHRVPLSDGCSNLLERMLEPLAAERITIEDIKQHPWFQEGLDPALLALKQQCMDLPSPCVLTEQQLEQLVAEVQAVLQPQLPPAAQQVAAAAQ